VKTTPKLSEDRAVVDAYDAVLLDLDGVVYLGPHAVAGAPEAVARLHQRGIKTGFVTNNAARPPAAIAEHLRELGIEAVDSDVVTAAQAAAHLLVERFGEAAKVLVVGGHGVLEALAERALTPVSSADDNPVAVIQGWAVDLTWEQLNEAAIAIHRGAHWVATNTDPTRPTDRGLVPGNGAAVAAVRMAVGVQPEVAGKPYRPLLDETTIRLGADRPIFIGDRLDTDIAGAISAGMDSMLVLTGSHRARDLLAAAPDQRPTHLGRDLAALFQPPLIAVEEGEAIRCGAVRAREVNGRIVFDTAPAAAELHALWAAAQISWHALDAGCSLDVEPVLSELGESI
jgi:HAD superfamily hydrolase (TIGR01450 family)